MNEGFQPEELLARIARQDVAALSEIYDRYSPCVYGLIAHIVPLRSAAEELLQEVFARLWRECPTLRQEGGSMLAWLVLTARAAAVERARALRSQTPDASARNQGGNGERGLAKGGASKAALRVAATLDSRDGKGQSTKARRTPAAGVPVIAPVPPAWLPEPKQVSLLDERLVLLHKTMNQLPKAQLQALDLAVFTGLSENEIADEMGEPLAKAQRSLRAAMVFLKHRRRAVCGTWAANI